MKLRPSPLVLAVVVSAAAHAQIVTLRVENQPLKEVLQSLERQTGWRLDIVGAIDPLADRLVSVTADELPLKEVLDDICEQAGARWRRVQANLVWIQDGPDLSEPPEVEVEGFRIRIKQIRIADDAHFTSTEGGVTTRNYLQITFEVEAPTDEAADVLFGLHPGAEVVDDTGKVLAPQNPDYAPNQNPVHRFPSPDRFAVSPLFAQPAENATSLRSIAGELTVYQDQQVVRAEFDWKDEEQIVEVDGLAITLAKLSLNPQPGALQGSLNFRLEGLPPAPDMRTGTLGCRVKLEMPNGVTLVVPRGGGGSGWVNDGILRGLYSTSFSFQGEWPAPERIVFEWPLPGGTLVGLPYRFENVPLPQRPGR